MAEFKPNVPVVQKDPIVTVDIDKEIPVEHYHAVAEIIGYVTRLRRGLSGLRQ